MEEESVVAVISELVFPDFMKKGEAGGRIEAAWLCAVLYVIRHNGNLFLILCQQNQSFE